MQLNLLDRKEKLKFLDLAMHMAAVDKEISIRETNIMMMFAAEVGEGILNEYTFELSQDLDETIQFFSTKENHIKNLVYMNLLYMTFSGEDYNVSEHFMLEGIKKSFDISDNKKQQFLYIIFSYRDLQDKLLKVIYE